MLKELKLTNWKSYRDGTLYIDPLTIIIGANASGKSNVLDALLFLQRAASGVALFQAINGDVNLTAIRGGMDWICPKSSDQFTLTLLTDGPSARQDYQYELTVQVKATKAEVLKEDLSVLTYRPRSETRKKSLFTSGRGEPNSLGLPTYFITGTQGRGRRVDLNRTHLILFQAEAQSFRKNVQAAIKHVLEQLRGIFVFDPIPSHMRHYTPLSEELQADGSNIAGVLAGLDDPEKGIEKTLTRYLQPLPERDIKRVWTESVGKFKTDAMLYCEEGWEGALSNEIDARGMSDGTLRYLAIVTALLTRQPGSLLVIEEVDNGLHPSRAHLLIKMLQELGKDRNIDIIVTTHNPALLDAAGMDMLSFIAVAHRDEHTGSSQLNQLEDIDQLPKLLASGSLGKLNTEGRIEAALKQDGQ